jgi:hypothetical protein
MPRVVWQAGAAMDDEDGGRAEEDDMGMDADLKMGYFSKRVSHTFVDGVNSSGAGLSGVR